MYRIKLVDKKINNIKLIDTLNKKINFSKRIYKACDKLISNYNNNPLKAPILRLGVYDNGEYDLKFNKDMKYFKKVNLLNYLNKNRNLDLDTILKEFYNFLITKSSDLNYYKNDQDFKIIKDKKLYKAKDDETTYKDYLTKKLNELDKKDFRYILIKIALKMDKGWAYVKDPTKLNGDEYDVITPNNVKKVLSQNRGTI